MQVLNALVLALLLAAALMPRRTRKSKDELGVWRYIAAGAGALLPYSEVLLNFMGPGAVAQAYHGLTWSVLLMPVYAFVLAEFIGITAEISWRKMWAPVVTGLACTWVLGALTEEGVFPFALLIDWRLGLAVLNGFDAILLGLCVMGLVMVRVVPAYGRELARLSLLCVAIYLLMAAWWSFEARQFGGAYADALRLDDAVVRVVPQPFSPLKWRVVVSEGNGRVHETRISMARDRQDPDEPTAADEYLPRDRAVWKIERRYGPAELTDEDQRRIRLAWYAWQATPFGWLGRYALFQRFTSVPQAGVDSACVSFRDLRSEGSPYASEGVYVVCPGRSGAARVFVPVGAPDTAGNWKALDELIPVMFAVRR